MTRNRIKRVYRGGLVLTRETGDSFYLTVRSLSPQTIRIDVRSMNRGQVRLGILAEDNSVEITRGEIFERGKNEVPGV